MDILEVEATPGMEGAYRWGSRGVTAGRFPLSPYFPGVKRGVVSAMGLFAGDEERGRGLPRLRSGYRLAARTPPKRLNLFSGDETAGEGGEDRDCQNRRNCQRSTSARRRPLEHPMPLQHEQERRRRACRRGPAAGVMAGPAASNMLGLT